MRWLLVLTLLLSGCEMIESKSDNDRIIVSECEVTHTDGTVMACKHMLKQNEGTDTEGKSIDMPIQTP
jgi:hypothetical protein